MYIGKNICSPIADSIFKNTNYIRTIKLTDQIINQIKADQFPDFALTEFEQFMIPLKNPNAPLLERLLSRNRPNMWKGQWSKTNLHYYPFYLWPENNFCYVESEENKYNLLFNTSKKILNGEVIKPITKTKHTALKTLLSKNVLEIKKLVDKIGSSNEFNVSFVRRNLFIYDDSNFITDTLITELNKKIQLYGQVVVDTTELNTIIL